MTGFAIILLFLFAGEILHFSIIPLPGSVIGMILLTMALAAGVVKEKMIKKAVGFLLKNMSFFFVPAGVGMMVHAGTFGSYWLQISFAIVFSYVCVLLSVGLLQRLIGRKRRNS